jgi:hypothetical protein
MSALLGPRRHGLAYTFEELGFNNNNNNNNNINTNTNTNTSTNRPAELRPAATKPKSLSLRKGEIITSKTNSNKQVSFNSTPQVQQYYNDHNLDDIETDEDENLDCYSDEENDENEMSDEEPIKPVKKSHKVKPHYNKEQQEALKELSINAKKRKRHSTKIGLP